MKIFGVIGNPVSHSLSPALHGMLYEQTGFDGNYSRYPVAKDEIKNVITAMKTLGISGINVTSPYKRDIIPFMDELSSEAAEIGAVNTVHLREDGTVMGHNTDSYGFAESLLHAGIEIAGKSFVVCGTSGAGKAVCHALNQYGAAKVVTASTNAENGVAYSELEHMHGIDVIVNCTPLGMRPHEDESPVPPHIFGNFSAAVDLIYNPWETVFLRGANRAGLKTLNGLPMLVFQGIRSFELWTGIDVKGGGADKIIGSLSCILRKNQV